MPTKKTLEQFGGAMGSLTNMITKVRFAKGNKKYERGVEDLKLKEKKILLAIQKGSHIHTMELIDTWEDDHIVCVGAKINGVEIGFWWVGPEFAGYLKCTDSKIARGFVAEEIMRQCELL